MNFAQTGSNLLFRSNGSIWGGESIWGREGSAAERHRTATHPGDRPAPTRGGTANPGTEHTPARERPSERWLAGAEGEGLGGTGNAAVAPSLNESVGDSLSPGKANFHAGCTSGLEHIDGSDHCGWWGDRRAGCFVDVGS
jgi:hypothetical protein